MVMTPVESSNVKEIGYDAESGMLRVSFKSGETYEYKGVPPDTHRKFMDADSKGGFFYHFIRNDFESKKLDAGA